VIVDASVLLGAFFPDEQQAQAQAVVRDRVVGRVRLAAPTLWLYEVTNAAVQATRRGRITTEQAEDILASVEGLGIALRPVTSLAFLPFPETVAGLYRVPPGGVQLPESMASSNIWT
jgi:predicted nucleic acid-binding protein